MADIDTPEVAANLTDDARRLREEIRLDEAKLRLKKLEVSKCDHALAIQKIDYEVTVLHKEIKELEAKKTK